MENDIVSVAAGQHGLITRRDARDLGATDHEIRWRLNVGRMEEPHPGVYYLNCTPATTRTRILSAVMAAGPDAVASHRTAGLLHGFDGIFGNPIDVTVPYSESPEPEGVILHRTRRPLDPVIVDMIPVTSVERTVLDLARIFGDRSIERVTASALRKKVTTPERLDAFIGLRGGRGVGGTRRLRRVLGLVADDMSGSVAEVDMRRLLLEAPIPSPIQQLQIRLPNGSHAYPDFAWPDRMRLAEVDGLDAHASPEQLTHDLDRQNQLMELGWEVRRFPAQMVRRDPLRVVTEITRFVMAPISLPSVHGGRD